MRTTRFGRLWLVGLGLGLAIVTLRAGQPSTGSGVLFFEGARLITGDGSAPIESSAFIVEGNKFTSVGRKGQLQAPAGATRVDLTGKTVMPGIVDSHSHIGGKTREELVEVLYRLAWYGIAVSTSLGNDVGELPFELRANPVPGATWFRTAGRGIVTPQPGRSEAPYWITSEAEARKAVQELAPKKVDLVKIWVDDRGGTLVKMNPGQYGAVIDEAHKHNLRVAAHIWALEDAKGLLKAGLDVFAHGVRDKLVDDEVMALFKQHPNVYYVPNLPERDDGLLKDDLSWLKGAMSGEAFDKLAQALANPKQDMTERFEVQWGNLAIVHAAGVKIGFGTDGALGYSAHVEMADMVSSGMTPAEVIVAATKTSAELLRLPDSGMVAANKNADFIVLNANPLDDIRNTRKIADVYVRGTKVDRAGLTARWTGRPSQ